MKTWFWFIFLSATAFDAHAQSNFFVEFLAGQSERESESVDDPALGVRGGYAFTENFSVELAYRDYGENSENILIESMDFIAFPGINDALPPVAFVDPGVTGFDGPVFGVDGPLIGIDGPFGFLASDIRGRDTISALSLGVAWAFPLSDDFRLLGRLGVSRAEVDLDAMITIFPSSESTETEIVELVSLSDTGTSAYLGLGIRYDISGRFFVGAEYEMNDVDFMSSTIDTGTASLSLGIQL